MQLERKSACHLEIEKTVRPSLNMISDLRSYEEDFFKAKRDLFEEQKWEKGMSTCHCLKPVVKTQVREPYM